MAELWIVLQREFVERVRSRSFLVSTVLTPLLLSLFIVIPALSDRPAPPDEPRIVVVDESGEGVGEAVARAMEAPGGLPLRMTVLRRPMTAVEDSLVLLLGSAAGVDGLLWIPPAAVGTGTASYRVRAGAAARLEPQLSLALSGAVVQARLRRMGVESSVASDLFEPVRMATSLVGGRAAGEEDDDPGVFLGVMVGFSLYFLILLYGVQVLQSVQEEKNNRIAEVLVSSMRASNLMRGKVLGVGLTALLQVSVWAAFGLVAYSRRAWLTEILGAPALFEGLRPPEASLSLAAMVGFAVLGFFLYASLFAAAGAAAATTEDAQRFTMPLITPLLIPVLVAQPIVEAPYGALATSLAWFPLTSPVTMPMRIGAGAMDAPETLGSLLLLLVATYAMGTLAGKIYRVGILSTGKRPSLRELARWARAG